MIKTVLTIAFSVLLFAASLTAQQKEIIYVFPDCLKDVLLQQIKEQKYLQEKKHFLVFYTSNKYDEISICVQDSSAVEINKIVEKSNRIVKLNNKRYPIIFDTDLRFSDLLYQEEGEVVTEKIIILKGFSIRMAKNDLCQLELLGFTK